MEIGKEKETITITPIENPVPHREPAPQRKPEKVPSREREPEKV